MRALLIEVLTITLVSVALVCAALGMLPGDPDSTWLGRTEGLLQTAFTLNFAGARWANPSAFSVIFRASMLSVAIIGATAASLVVIGVPLGIASVTRSRSLVVRLVRKSVTVLSSLPVLVLGTLLYIFALREFGIELREDRSLAAAMIAAIATLVLGDRLLADIVQRVELGTRAVLAEPYMRAVRAADLGFQRHLLQSLVPPVTEALVARSVFLISGAIVAELVFYVHGLGFTVEAAVKADDPKKILAASMALIAIGLSFRILHRGSLAMADARRRG